MHAIGKFKAKNAMSEFTKGHPGGLEAEEEMLGMRSYAAHNRSVRLNNCCQFVQLRRRPGLITAGDQRHSESRLGSTD